MSNLLSELQPEEETPETRKARVVCLYQWLLVLIVGVFAGVAGEALGGIWAALVSAAGGLIVAGVAVSLYLRWKKSRRRGQGDGHSL